MERRGDVPAALAAVLDIALAVDPGTRYASATEFASALSQVMKHAVGVDPVSALGTAVREARMHERPHEHDVAMTEPSIPTGSTAATIPGTRKSVDVEFSVADMSEEPIELTKPKK